MQEQGRGRHLLGPDEQPRVPVQPLGKDSGGRIPGRMPMPSPESSSRPCLPPAALVFPETSDASHCDLCLPHARASRRFAAGPGQAGGEGDVQRPRPADLPRPLWLPPQRERQEGGLVVDNYQALATGGARGRSSKGRRRFQLSVEPDQSRVRTEDAAERGEAPGQRAGDDQEVDRRRDPGDERQHRHDQEDDVGRQDRGDRAAAGSRGHAAASTSAIRRSRARPSMP